MKARPLGRKGVVVGDRVARGRRRVRRRRRAGAHRARSPSARTVLRRTADDDDPVERVIVANADQLVVVTALADPEPRPRLIDRCLVAAYDAGMDAAAVPDQGRPRRPRDAAVDLPAARRAVRWSTRRGGDLAEAARRGCAGRTSVLVGPQRRRQVDAGQRAGARRRPRRSAYVNAVTGRGRHTSTSAVRSPLPGRRRLDRRHPGHPVLRPRPRRSRTTLIEAFPDLDEMTEDCPRGCTHGDGRAGVRARRGRRARRRRPRCGSSRSGGCSTARSLPVY